LSSSALIVLLLKILFGLKDCTRMSKEAKSNIEDSKSKSQVSSFSKATTVKIPQGKIDSSSRSSEYGEGHPINSINSNGSKEFFLGSMPNSHNKSPVTSKVIKSSSDGSSGSDQLQAG
jgi:hypothetical protein